MTTPDSHDGPATPGVARFGRPLVFVLLILVVVAALSVVYLLRLPPPGGRIASFEAEQRSAKLVELREAPPFLILVPATGVDIGNNGFAIAGRSTDFRATRGGLEIEGELYGWGAGRIFLVDLEAPAPVSGEAPRHGTIQQLPGPASAAELRRCAAEYVRTGQLPLAP